MSTFLNVGRWIWWVDLNFLVKKSYCKSFFWQLCLGKCLKDLVDLTSLRSLPCCVGLFAVRADDSSLPHDTIELQGRCEAWKTLPERGVSSVLLGRIFWRSHLRCNAHQHLSMFFHVVTSNFAIFFGSQMAQMAKDDFNTWYAPKLVVPDLGTQKWPLGSHDHPKVWFQSWLQTRMLRLECQTGIWSKIS